MCRLAPHTSMIFNNPHKLMYILHFGWGIKGLNDLYFGKFGTCSVFPKPKYYILSLCSFKEGLFRINL